MGQDRVIFLDWIEALGRDPVSTGEEIDSEPGGYNTLIITAVNQALNSLARDEAFLIRALYMQGMEFREISEITGRAVRRLDALHQRALKKLKRRLYEILKGKFNIPSPHDPACPLCNHPEAAEINRLVRTKTGRETWRRIMKILDDRYDLKLTTPQWLVGHQKYHLSPEEEP